MAVQWGAYSFDPNSYWKVEEVRDFQRPLWVKGAHSSDLCLPSRENGQAQGGFMSNLGLHACTSGTVPLEHAP
jgi:hypothetical protein